MSPTMGGLLTVLVMVWSPVRRVVLGGSGRRAGANSGRRVIRAVRLDRVAAKSGVDGLADEAPGVPVRRHPIHDLAVLVGREVLGDQRVHVRLVQAVRRGRRGE